MRVLLRRASGLFALGSIALACSTGDVAEPYNNNAPNLSKKNGTNGTAATSLSACTLGATLDGTKVKACVDEANSKGIGAGPCLDPLFEDFLIAQKGDTKTALEFVQCLIGADDELNLGCHPVAHSVGRGTFLVEKTVDASFRVCDETCHSGCFHGAMERFLRGDDVNSNGHLTLTEIKLKAATACEVPGWDLQHKFQCLHGLGHALMYYMRIPNPDRYDLKGALDACDATGDAWNASSCWGGAFMENIAAGEPQLRDLNNDPQYPCTIVDDKYKDSCYIMQTSRMSELGLSSDQILVECRKAGQYRLTCDTSMGRDLSNGARDGNGKSVSSTCEKGQDDDEVFACTRGVVFALVDNTWDGKYALPYCQTYATGDKQAYCFSTSLSYMAGVYAKDAGALGAECDKYAPGDARCKAAVPKK